MLMAVELVTFGPYDAATAACWAAAEGCGYSCPCWDPHTTDVPPMHSLVPQPRILTDLAALNPAA
jgi:hypothetical protein